MSSETSEPEVFDVRKRLLRVGDLILYTTMSRSDLAPAIVEEMTQKHQRFNGSHHVDLTLLTLRYNYNARTNKSGIICGRVHIGCHTGVKNENIAIQERATGASPEILLQEFA